MARSEWEAIAEDSAKVASDARGHLRLKTKEEDEFQAKATALIAPATPLQIMVQSAPVSPEGDAFGALGGEVDVAPPDVPSDSGVCLYIRKLFTLADDHKILKGASFQVKPDTNELCQGWPKRHIVVCCPPRAISLPWRPLRASLA